MFWHSWPHISLRNITIIAALLEGLSAAFVFFPDSLHNFSCRREALPWLSSNGNRTSQMSYVRSHYRSDDHRCVFCSQQLAAWKESVSLHSDDTLNTSSFNSNIQHTSLSTGSHKLCGIQHDALCHTIRSILNPPIFMPPDTVIVAKGCRIILESLYVSNNWVGRSGVEDRN